MISKVASTYKLYANSTMLQQNSKNAMIPLNVREKLFQCGVPS